MKIRFEKNRIAYRLSPEESDQLLEKYFLCANTVLPDGKKFHFKLRLETDAPIFICEDNNVELNIPHKTFKDSKPTKAGLEFTFQTSGDDLTVAIEVDLKKLRKKI